MVATLGLGPLFGAVSSLIPATSSLRTVVDILGDTNDAYELLATTAKGFYSSVIGSNLELQGQIGQSSIVLASQLDVYDEAGIKVDDFTSKLESIGPKVVAVQKEIELATRDIVGATDTLTNSILNQTINQFSQLQGQTKEFASELEALPQLVVGLTSAFTTFQLPEFQVPQEIRSLLQGDLNNPDSQLARQLQSVGLTKELLEQAKASGTAIDLLNEKLASFVAANASGADTVGNSFSIITDITQQLFRSLGEDPTEGLRKGLLNVVDIINDPEFEKSIRSIAESFGGPVGQAIESTFAKITASAVKVGTILDETLDFEEVAEQFGKLLGDFVSLTGDAVIGIGTIISTLVAGLGKVLSILDYIITSLNGILDLVTIASEAGDIDLRFDVATEEGRQEIEDFQKELDSKGPLRKFIDFIVSPLGINLQLNMATEEAIKQTNDLFKQEFDRTSSQQTFLLDIAAKVRDADTSSVEDFTADLKQDLETGIEGLRDVIDFNNLGEDVQTKIEEVLNNITSASQFGEAQRQIVEIIKISAAGGEEVFKQYQAQLQLIDTTIEAAIARRDELADLANANRLTGTEREELEKLNLQIVNNRELRKSISVALDPVIAKQFKVIEQLKEEGKATEEAEKQLDELIKRRREAGDPATLGGKPALDLGASLVKVFSDLNTAVSAYQTKVAKTSPQISQDFEKLSQTLTTALDFGAATVDQAINLLQAAVTDVTLPIEQRVAAEKQLISLIQSEAKLVKNTLSIEQQRNDLLVQRGELFSEEAAVLNSQVQARQLEVDIVAKQNELAANRLLIQNGAKEDIEDQLELLNKQLETAEETDKVLIQERINTQEKLLKDVEVTTQKQKQLEVDIEKLQIEKEGLDLKTNELRIDEALSNIARKRQQAEQEINTIIAKRGLELAKERQGGALVVDLDIRRQEGSIDDTRAKLTANEAEILRTITEIEGIRNDLTKEGVDLQLSKTKELQLQKQIVDLENEGVKLNTDLINQQLGLEETLRQQAINKQQQLIQLKQATLDAEFSIEDANNRILQSILDSEKASQKLRDSFAQLGAVISSIEIANINLELQGIDKVEALEERLKNVEFGSRLSIGITEAIKTTKDLFNVSSTGINEQIRLIEERKQRELAAARDRLRAELDVINTTSQQERLSLEIADQELLKEQELLKIKRLQLEIEKDIIEAKLQSGDIDEDTSNQQLSNLDRQGEAYDKISDSLGIQRDTNQKIRDDIGTIANNQEKIAELNGEQEEKNIIISNETEKIDRNQKSIEKSSQNFADSSGVTASNTRLVSQNVKETSVNISLVESTAKKIEVGNFSLGNSFTAGSFDAGNIFGVDFADFLDEYNTIREESKRFVEQNQSSLAGVGVSLDRDLAGLDEINQRAEKAYLKAEIQFQDALSKARGEFRDSALEEVNRNETTARTFTDQTTSSSGQSTVLNLGQRSPNTSDLAARTAERLSSGNNNEPLTNAQIITQALAEIGRLSQLTQTPQVVSEINKLNKTITDILTSAQNDPQIRAAQARLATLLAVPSRNEAQDSEIQELLSFIDEATNSQDRTEDQKVTATTLIEAINSGAFQAGSFTPENDSTLFQNPETGEIIIGGTRLDEAQLDTLFEIKNTNTILSQIESNTREQQVVISSPPTLENTTSSTSVRNNVSTSNQRVEVPNLAPKIEDPGPNLKEKILAISVLAKPESALGAKLDALETLGFITEQQQKVTQLKKVSGATTSSLKIAGFITDQEKNLFDAGLKLSDSDPTNDSQAQSLVSQAGFASLEEGLAALNSLPSLADFQGAFNAQVIPNIENLINEALRQNSVFAGGVNSGFARSSGGSSGGETSPGVASTRVQNVTINNYPNNVGTTNSVLREGGL